MRYRVLCFGSVFFACFQFLLGVFLLNGYKPKHANTPNRLDIMKNIRNIFPVSRRAIRYIGI